MRDPNIALWIALQTGVPVLTTGDAGVAKTASAEAFARATGRHLYTLIGSLRDPADIGGYPFVVHNGEESVMKLISPQWAAEFVKRGAGNILFLDELTGCAPAVQSALLRVVAELVCGDMPLPRDTWIIAACNPPGIAANGHDIEPPMANRFFHHRWKMNFEGWKAGLMNGMNFPAPEFPLLPDNWRDHRQEVAGLVAAANAHAKHWFSPGINEKGETRMDRSKLNGAWPSPRSWTLAINAIAGARSVLSGDDLADVEAELLRGCVGQVADEFLNWRDNLDLPNSELLMMSAKQGLKTRVVKGYQHPDRPDKVIAMLNSVTGVAIRAEDKKESWDAAMLIFEKAWEADKGQHLDVALACIHPLVNAQPAGCQASTEFVKVAGRMGGKIRQGAGAR